MCDIRDHTDVQQLARDVTEWMPTIDVLINNAAVWTDNEIEATDPARRKLAFETNVVGNMQVTEAFLPTLRAQHDAHILNVISVSGDILSPAGDNRLWSTYGATKWALAGYTKTLREQLAETPIRVSGLFPGGIDTNFYENAGKTDGTHDQPWMMRADDIADIVLFMLTRPHDVHIESLTVVKA
jgi:NADP-dependent 3-hydroxy acid dehydrogenase YdfG